MCGEWNIMNREKINQSNGTVKDNNSLILSTSLCFTKVPTCIFILFSLK